MKNSFVNDTRIFIATAALACLTPNLLQAQATATHTIVPGYERFRTETMTDVDAGRLLISELNCQSCHGPLSGNTLPQRQAPILTSAARRIQPEHILDFLRHPQTTKPGTAMPELLNGPDAQKDALALTHFLMSNGAVALTSVDAKSVARGEGKFHSLGCAACHGDQRVSAADRPPFAMPLGSVSSKYTVDSLLGFLRDPHSVRPSGRMPSLNLSNPEARDIANYLLRDIKVDPHLVAEYFEGRWDRLPNFDIMELKDTIPTTGFDTTSAKRASMFGLRFKAFVHIPSDGNYQFWLGSKDGSRLSIDGNVIIDADGIHPNQLKLATKTLTAGIHPVVVEYFQVRGDHSLTCEIAGPGVPRQPLAGLATQSKQPQTRRKRFQVDAALATTGKQLFTTAGCASCHQHDAVAPAADTSNTVPAFADLKLNQGCLSTQPGKSVPRFALSDQQTSDIVAALKQIQKASTEPTPEQRISEVMLTLNCYACHQRDELGGVPRIHNELFTGTIPGMGDEGRIPPHLTGIGDKLKQSWLANVMNQGTKDRPYMTTRMPKFGEHNVGSLISLMAETDRQTEIADVEFDQVMHRVKAEARKMVGDQALSCIKCHTFGKYKATGIQSLDMTTMTKRLRRDWFHRYLLNPQGYRPGTRMPSAWPNNRSVVPKILNGDPAQQIEAIWKYLAAGRKAPLPSGLIAKAMELKPTARPIVYRNFLEGLSPRGIAVGYPEKAHIAWDAEHMNLRLIWHGAFLDASMHRVGSGVGLLAPLGDHVLSFPAGPPLALLESSDDPWPNGLARDNGFAFHGYRLNSHGQPRFRYSWSDVQVEDYFQPVEGKAESSIKRTLTLNSPKAVSNLHFRVTSAETVVEKSDVWLVDGGLRIQFVGQQPILRRNGDKTDLLVPINFADDGSATIRCEMSW